MGRKISTPPGACARPPGYGVNNVDDDDDVDHGDSNGSDAGDDVNINANRGGRKLTGGIYPRCVPSDLVEEIALYSSAASHELPPL